MTQANADLVAMSEEELADAVVEAMRQLPHREYLIVMRHIAALTAERDAALLEVERWRAMNTRALIPSPGTGSGG